MVMSPTRTLARNQRNSSGRRLHTCPWFRIGRSFCAVNRSAYPGSAIASVYRVVVVIRLIGAGLPRTGTSSLREALRFLLDGPIYHMSEAYARPEHVPTWVAAINGEPPQWTEFLDEYTAGVDTPFSCCWRDLAAAYRDAPVVLSHRGSAETWYRSMDVTVLQHTRKVLALDDDTDPMTPLFRVMFKDVFADPDDADQVKAGYERRLAEVRAEIESSRLIEWQPGDGWGPICAALGIAVPAIPFPHRNSMADFLSRARHVRDPSADQSPP